MRKYQNNWQLFYHRLSYVVGRIVHINSCTSSKPFRAWLFIWHVGISPSAFSVKTLKRLKTCTFNLGNCSLSVSSHAMVSITASYSTTLHYMQGIDTFIKNWLASIRVVSISKAYFYFLLSKAYIIIIVIIKIHIASTPTVRNLNYGKIIQCALSLELYSLFQATSLFDFPWSLNAGQTNGNFYIFKSFGSHKTLVTSLVFFMWNVSLIYYQIVTTSPSYDRSIQADARQNSWK